MRWIQLLGVWLVVALWAGEPQLAAQKQGQLFIKLVGPDGTPVTDLQASDLMITEDGDQDDSPFRAPCIGNPMA